MKHFKFSYIFLVVFSLLILLLEISCKTVEPKQPAAQQEQTEAVSGATEEVPSQPTTEKPSETAEQTPPVQTYATEQEKAEALFDIREFIFTLNKIVQRKDFEAWYSYLTADYVKYYSDPAVLAELSSQPTLRKYNIVLKSLKDYFLYVVYPSRQNDTVDEIEYIGYNKVIVYTYVNNVKLVLYVLEKINGKWMISR